MTSSTYIGVDFGHKKIGVAVGQDLTGTTQGLATLSVTSTGSHLDQLIDYARQWQVNGFVIGLPLDGNGAETGLSRQVRGFAKQLRKKSQLPVYWVNEHLTSQSAHQQLRETLAHGKRYNRKKQSRRDQLAAELILRSYLEYADPES